MTRPTLALLVCAWLAAQAAGQPSPAGILALGPDFPKAVHYRYADNFKVKPGHEDFAYGEWWANYGRAMGAELDKRVTLDDPGRWQVIRRIKREHPEQFLIYYSTGHIKVPVGEGPGVDPASGAVGDYSPGHWLYLPRVRVLGDVPAASGVSQLRFERPRTLARSASEGPAVRGSTSTGMQDEDVAGARTSSLFSLRPDRGDDLCLYALGPDGQPDWPHAEQVTLVGLDERAATIRVQRGCYGTSPGAFSGRVFVAVHAEVVKFHGWLYNFSTFCPRDAQDRTAGDVWAAAYARAFQPHGIAADFDALQHDTLIDYGASVRGSDMNNNGLDDSTEELGGVNWFAVGVCQALEKLGRGMPPGKLLVPDAGNRGFQYVHGWEVEGFPGRHDPAWRQYSELCNRLELSRHLCREPRYTHVQHKVFNFILGIDGQPEILQGAKLPFHLSRAVLGLATAYEAAVTWYSLPPPTADGRPGVYDEICLGAENRLGWLGRALDEPLYPACSTPDLCAGIRNDVAAPDRSHPERSEGSSPASRQILRCAQNDGSVRLTFSLTLPEPQLFLLARLRGAPRAGVPVKLPRLVRVSVRSNARPSGYLLPSDAGQLEAGWLLADGSSQPLAPEALRQEFVGGFHHSLLPEEGGWHALRISAKQHGATHAWWQARCRVPAEGRLSLGAFRGAGTYRVEAAEVRADGTLGPLRTIVEAFSPTGPSAMLRNVALAPLGLAGKEVLFRFLCTAPNGRAEATWAEPTVGRPVLGDTPPAGPVWRSIEGFAAETCQTQTFHFNHLPAGVPLEVSIEVEGREEVLIERLSAYAANGAVARRFEHGLVLVNPSLAAQTFDLARLAPGLALRRFQGTPQQDPAANDGQPAGPTVTLGPLDGLFLVRSPEKAE